MAAHLGQPNVDAMLASMTREQLEEWAAFNELEPFGYFAEWRKIGELCATMHESLMLVVEAQGAEIRNRQHLKAEDFVPMHPIDKTLKRKRTNIRYDDVRADEALAQSLYG